MPQIPTTKFTYCHSESACHAFDGLV